MWSFWQWLIRLLQGRRQETHIEWKIGPMRDLQVRTGIQIVKKYFHKEKVPMSLIMTAVQECPLEVAFKDKLGNPAKADNITWSTSDEAIIKVFPGTGPDTAKAIVAATGPAGTGQVNVKADADLGDGVKEIVGVLDVEIMAAEATVVEISAGTPQDQNPAINPEPQKGGKGKK